ncbi:MAG TPA: SPOR domain-containing protein [Blastocatellia bacterium]|nr:SPOR domain-containing protein [Blastocatellia bacterium]HMY71974.1 SPOR domain-containing protein [Blastocatellia bacterium]HMZ16966.1 SPOR domain-containing protein [Blastocatellia bacterium]HNG34113.1 SPOR domain-containing protein [Blastocatellia bacterium]
MAREYSVQIAAVRSQQCADDMRSGLLVQGLEAYWVKGALPEHGLFYRVRLGKFSSIESAYTYAEALLNSGLLESYAITAYEAPMSAPLRDMTQASIEVQEYIQPPQGPSPKEMNELFAAIGARQWILPSSRNLFAPKPKVAAPDIKLSSGQPSGMTGREMLVFALRNHEWRMTPDPSVFFVRAPMVASSIDLAVNPASPKFDAPPVVPPVTSSVVSGPPASGNASSSSRNSAAPVIDLAGSTTPLTPPPGPSSTAINPPSPTNSSFNTVRTAATDIGKGSKPTAPGGIGYAGKNLGPRLQATSELRNGQLIMKLRNLDTERAFTGVARITINDDKNSNEVRPQQFNLPPDVEIELPLEDPVAMGSNWMLMVFDEKNALRLVRGATIGTKPLAGSPGSATNQSSLNSPQYVTGAPVTYDATGASPVGVVPPIEMPNTTGLPSDNAANGQPPSSVAGAEAAPAQLTVTPRQIAVTTENVTMEFEIASPQPLNYISVTLAAGEYRDVRQALMSTTRGRVPFLIPAAQANGTFLYEIKDEAGRVLAGGAGDFRQLAPRR